MAAFLQASNVVVDESAGTATFTVRLIGTADGPVSVSYAFLGSTATEGIYGDFTGIDGSLSFALGETSKTITVNLIAYQGVESFESFYMKLASPVGATLLTETAWATIVDNDTVVGDTDNSGVIESDEKANLSVTDVVVDEKLGTATFSLVLDKATTSAFTVAYSTAAGTATAGSDFTAVSGSVQFAAGQTSRTISVSIVDDTTVESAEQFALTLGALSGTGASQVQVADRAGHATIGASDQTAQALPMLSVGSIVVDEGRGWAEFTVALNAPGQQTVSVNYAISGSTAGEGIYADFLAVDGTLRFAPGMTTQTVRVDLNSYQGVESAEGFYLQLSTPVNAAIANNVAWATIVDDDTRVTDLDSSGTLSAAEQANLSVRGVIVDEKAGLATFSLVLDKATTDAFTVTWSTATTAGTAAAGSDFVAASGTTGFAPGQTVQQVTVSLLDDAVVEADEFFNLTLGTLGGPGAGQVQIADGIGQATIGRSDALAQATPMITASPVVVDEGAGYAEFVVQLSAPGQSTVSVNYAFGGSTASEGIYGDFLAVDGTLRFAPGVTTQTVRIDLNTYQGVESRESLYLQLSSPVNAAIANDVVWATVVDNDLVVTDTDSSGSLGAAERANLVVRDLVVDEKAGLATFDLVLDKATTQAFGVSYSTATKAGTAVAGEDFTAATGTVRFAAGQTVQHVTVAITDDGVAEGAETLFLSLTGLGGAGAAEVQLADPLATALIGRSDGSAIAAPVISARPILVSESDGYAEFAVELSAPGTGTVSVNYSFNSSTAGAGIYGDFLAVGGTLRFAPGVTTQTVRVDLNSYEGIESLESFQLKLSSPVNASIASDTVWATIVDDDRVVTDTNSSGAIEAPEKANLSVRDVVVDERAGIAVFDLVLDKAPTQPFTVAYTTATQPGSATAGSDFVAASGTVGFAPGQTTQQVVVSLLDDASAEGAEFFNLTLSAVAGAGASQVQLADAVGTAVIGRSDGSAVAAPVISARPIMVSESDGYAEFVVELSAPGSAAVSVNYAFGNGTATAGIYGDFLAASGTLRFAPGVTTQTVRVDLNGYQAGEPLESFYLQLSSPANASIANSVVWATIADDDSVVADANSSGVLEAGEKAVISVRDVVVDEKAGYATFDVVLDKATTQAFTVTYSTATTPGTATAGSDFVAASATLGFAAGQTVQHVKVALIDDALAEGGEYFHLTLGTIGGPGAGEVLAGDTIGAARIGASDAAAVALPVISASNIVVTEAAGYAEFVVQLSAPSTSAVSVNYAFASGTATAGVYGDFIAANGTLSFAPGTTTQTIRVDLNPYQGAEGSETFQLQLSTPTNASLAATTYTATIVDDDNGVTVLAYGLGNDTYTLSSTAQLVSEAAGGGVDTIRIAANYSLVDTDGTGAFGGNVENLSLTGTANFSGTGNALNNRLTGNGGANRLTGAAGSDTLLGGAGADVLVGGTGNDSLTGGTEADRFVLDNITGSDVVSDFAVNVDDIVINDQALGIRDVDRVVDGAVTVAGGGGFSSAAELVVVTNDIVGSLSTTSAAAAIGSANSAYAVGAKSVFVVDNGLSSAVYLFAALDADAAVEANELTLLATLQNVAGTTTADYLFGA